MRRRVLVGVVLGALCIAVATGALATLLAGAAGNSLPTADIMFARYLAKAERSDLYVMASDGSRLRLLTRDASQAAASPDGRRVAFVRDGSIWIMQRDGSTQTPLTRPSVRSPRKSADNPPRDDGPAWAPSGRTLYFVRSPGPEFHELFSVRDDGTHLVRLPVTSASRVDCLQDLSPSPDGRFIAFTQGDCWHGTGIRVRAVSPAGRAKTLPFRLAVPGGGYDVLHRPTWSPDGGELAYSFENPIYEQAGPDWSRGDRSGLYVSKADGSSPRRIAGEGWAFGGAAWSPDGGWIAAVGPGGVSLIHPDGTSPRALARKGVDPDWLPRPD